MEVYTIGHSTRSLEEFTTLLRAAGVRRVVDVRAFPMSRRHPQFNKNALSITLPATGLDYRHMPALGGRRHRQKATPPRNGFWKVEAFRNYADYAETAAFGSAITERGLGSSGSGSRLIVSTSIPFPKPYGVSEMVTTVRLLGSPMPSINQRNGVGVAPSWTRLTSKRNEASISKDRSSV
ncbi:MAG TPA: DUF488 domain-containing protein [Vicinamibacterales bacterium]|nr:DUF488 domain-containing protein [Vicinamibacterales bacterium]